MKELTAVETARLLRTAFRLFSEPGPGQPTRAQIAEAAGIAPAAIRHWYHDPETLYRLAVIRRIAGFAVPLRLRPRGAPPLREAIRAYAATCAAVFASDDYRRLLYLVMRDGRACPWLVAAHERGVVEVARAGLSRIVRQAGVPGAGLEIRAGGTRAFVRRLQERLSLSMLLPDRKHPTHLELRALIESVAGEALASVYSGPTLARALEEILPPVSPVPGRCDRRVPRDAFTRPIIAGSGLSAGRREFVPSSRRG
ncbi:MAG TPA: hypothetical protein VH331_17635 [Allosphingosinicella sp.]|jgi:AcrR family transcriptional regulator|nr:hypothetical protein [Allosphingosinicella sp.]